MRDLAPNMADYLQTRASFRLEVPERYNYARDVVAFLSWAADPSLEERKRMGLLVIGYLLITAVLLGFAKRRIWSSAH